MIAQLSQGTVAAPTILIVDDSPTIRRLARAFLADLGFTFIEAADGLLALAVVRVQPVDLVVADLRMPNLDGMGLLKAIRADLDEKLKHVPVVLLTMESDQAVAHAALDAGASAFLTKPVTPEALREVVQRLLSSAK